MDGQLNLNGGVEFTEVSVAERFRIECEQIIPRYGTGYINSKDRIIGYYNDGQLTEEVLRREYNNNRFPVEFKNGNSGMLEAGADGIEIYSKGQVANFKWKTVLEILKDAIYSGKYVNKRLTRWE